jgi:hypothetical protein
MCMSMVRSGGSRLVQSADEPRLVTFSHVDRLLQVSDDTVRNLDPRFGRLCDVLRKLDEVFDSDAVGSSARS